MGFGGPRRAAAQGKQRLLILCLDDSGSMQSSDPTRMRVEVSLMLADSLSPEDRFGAMAYGGNARWVVFPAPLGPAPRLTALGNLHAREQRTDFTAPLQLALGYLASQPPALFDDYDVSLVLLTDGAPDPDPEGSVKDKSDLAAANRKRALDLAARLRSMGAKIYTVGLRSSAEADFLTRLATAGDGVYAPAATAGDLRQAFVRVLANVAGLPIYAEFSDQSQFRLGVGPTAQSAWLFFLRDNPSSEIKAAGERVTSTSHIVVVRNRNPGREVGATVFQPEGTLALVGIDQPLEFHVRPQMPAVALSNTVLSVSASLMGGGADASAALFARAGLAAVRLQGPDGAVVTAPLALAGGSFGGKLKLPGPGEYRAQVVLSSLFGSVQTDLGSLRVVGMPVQLPAQVDLDEPSGLGWLPGWMARRSRLKIASALPVGRVELRFDPSDTLTASRRVVEIAPGHPARVSFWSSAPLSDSPQQLGYTATWSNGMRQDARRGVLVINPRAVSLATFVLEYKAWVAATAVLLLLVWGGFWRTRPPVLAGVLETSGGKYQAVGRRVEVFESGRKEQTSGGRLKLKGEKDRRLFAITLRRQGSQLHTQLHPAPGVQLSTHSPKNGECVMVDSRLAVHFYNFGRK